jgi:hypothetical protein
MVREAFVQVCRGAGPVLTVTALIASMIVSGQALNSL